MTVQQLSQFQDKVLDERQTVYNTLLGCLGFNELKEELWAGVDKRETDLARLVGTPVLAAK